MTAACLTCSAEIPAGARFCPSCGASLAPATDERRVVTVLFGDMVGFTPLSEVRDPERVKNMLDRCFERLSADITSHGGRVDKIVGDELMAVFGAPIAHEDDPERAVRAALQMQRTLQEHDPTGELRMRVGVNTGEVLVGSLRGGTDVTALGDVVNVASRLQVEAKPGEVLVGPSTYEATKDGLSYEPVGALEVKGRSVPVVAHRAVAALGPPGFRRERVRAPMVGRKSELGVLWHALSTAVSDRRPHLILLVGDAGMGKTILVEQATEIARNQHRAFVMQGRCLPYGEANPWWPVAEALRQACGIAPEDPAEVAASKCRSAVADVIGKTDEGVEASRVSDGLLYLMGYGGKLADVEPSRARDEAMRSIQVSLAANAWRRPLVVVLSELHWADQLVLDLVDSMLDRLRDLPMVLLATARPELLERWSPKPGRHNLLIVNLGPLGPDDSGELTRALLGSDASSEVVDLIVERSSGNPLFISELVAMLGTSTQPHTRADLEGSQLPATLRGLVAARLDSLEARDRSLLADAAVVGRSGPLPAVVSLAEARGETQAPGRLDGLVAADLLTLGDGGFEFRSEVVRDVAYETLTKGERARRHAAIAGWLDTYARGTGREEEYLERVAHHYAVTAELVAELGSVEGVPQDVGERALEWLDQAAARAEARDTSAASVHLLEHALGLLAPGDERRARFLLGRALGRAAQRDMEGAYADVDEVLTGAEERADGPMLARALTVRGEIEQKEGQLERSAETLKGAVQLWREVGERQGEAEALRLWGYTSIHRGMLDAAEDAISRALAISRELGDRRGEAWALQNLAWAAFSVGDNDLAEERLNASANLFQEIGDFGGHGWAMGLLGYVWYFKGRLEDASVIAEGGVQWSREMGDRWAYGMMLTLLATIRLWQGRTSEALERSSEAHRLFVEIDDDMGLGNSGMTLVWAQLYSGRADEAGELAARFVPEKREHYALGLGAAITAGTVWAIAGQGRGLELLDELASLGGDNTFLWSARALALALEGRFEEAYEDSVKAWGTETDPGPRANAACLHAMVSAFAGHGEEAVRAGDEVGRLTGTYIDQLRAHLGRALGYAVAGRRTESETAFASARRIADASEDVLHQSLVRLAEGTTRGGERGTEVVAEARQRLEAMGLTPESWERAFRRAIPAETTEPAQV